MNPKRAAAVLIVSALAMAATYAIALAPYQPVGSETGRLRLSWRMHGQVEEECRERTAEELEKIPMHMRTARVCEREAVHYHLSVRIDGVEVLARELGGGGAKGDRPIFVLEEIAHAAGPHRVCIRLDSEDDEHDDDEHERLGLDRIVSFDRGRIELIRLEDLQPSPSACK
jgi:hypothetical protein